MPLSNSIKIGLASAAGAIIVSSTILFPLIKDLNKTITEDSEVHTPKDTESNKTIQVISKNQNSEPIENNVTSSIDENPSINSSTIHSTNDPSLHNSDTINSNLLLEDIPHHKRN